MLCEDEQLIDTDGNGMVDEVEFVEYFDKHLSQDEKVFSETLDDFVRAAEKCGKPAPVEHKPGIKCTALAMAAGESRIDLCKELLAMGADLEASLFGVTPLALAALNGDVEVQYSECSIPPGDITPCRGSSRPNSQSHCP